MHNFPCYLNRLDIFMIYTYQIINNYYLISTLHVHQSTPNMHIMQPGSQFIRLTPACTISPETEGRIYRKLKRLFKIESTIVSAPEDNLSFDIVLRTRVVLRARRFELYGPRVHCRTEGEFRVVLFELWINFVCFDILAGC